jgi:hypothetical protein
MPGLRSLGRKAAIPGKILFPSAAGREDPVLTLGRDVSVPVLHRVRQAALPHLRSAVHVEGQDWVLRWEELDTDKLVILRHATPFAAELSCEWEEGRDGLVLRLPGAPESGIWLPSSPDAELRAETRARVGWSDGLPQLAWRYTRDAGSQVLLEATWRFPGVADEWVQWALSKSERIRCSTVDAEWELESTGLVELVFTGSVALPPGLELIAERVLRVEAPLGLWTPDLHLPAAGEWRGPLSVEVHDLRAEIGREVTRFVADEEAGQEFHLLVFTSADSVMPQMIPADVLPGIPCAVRCEPVEMPHAEARTRAWRLRPQGDQTWNDLWWKEGAFELRFGAGTVGARACLRRIQDRRVRLGWRVEGGADGSGLVGLVSEEWTAPGHLERLRLELDLARADFLPRIRTEIVGVVEAFVVDSESELPADRLTVGPEDWRVFDSQGAEVVAELYGHLGAHVRWRRPAKLQDDLPLRPTEWARGSSPVLALKRVRGGVPAWGGLYVPAEAPWSQMTEVHASEDGDRLVVAASRDAPAVWISLWGYVAGYERRALKMSRDASAPPATAWVTRTALPLFPNAAATLLRSFNPLHAVEDREDAVLALESSLLRPTLRIGRSLIRTRNPTLLRVGEGTRVRVALAPPGEPPASMLRVAVPGASLTLESVAEAGGLWLALEAPADLPGAPSGGYLVSWHAERGWGLQGFYAPEGSGVRLGTVQLPSEGGGRRLLPVVLQDTPLEGERPFTLTVDDSGVEWDAATPREVRDIPRNELIRWIEDDVFDMASRPGPLRTYERRPREQSDQRLVLEFMRGAQVSPTRLPIRVWQLPAGATTGGAAPPPRPVLGARAAPPAETASPSREAPIPRSLRPEAPLPEAPRAQEPPRTLGLDAGRPADPAPPLPAGSSPDGETPRVLGGGSGRGLDRPRPDPLPEGGEREA